MEPSISSTTFIIKSNICQTAAILTGYEMQLSGLLKRGSDLWLNTPKMYREASGTSGMTAAMNGSVNLSIPDGWIPEFSNHGKNLLYSLSNRNGRGFR
ncbi:MAG: hypothetical protein U5K54_21105 [Cytophagales bacterium]|nr:hypothetical protein [Cytophagales bacterium]